MSWRDEYRQSMEIKRLKIQVKELNDNIVCLNRRIFMQKPEKKPQSQEETARQYAMSQLRAMQQQSPYSALGIFESNPLRSWWGLG